MASSDDQTAALISQDKGAHYSSFKQLTMNLHYHRVYKTFYLQRQTRWLCPRVQSNRNIGLNTVSKLQSRFTVNDDRKWPTSTRRYSRRCFEL